MKQPIRLGIIGAGGILNAYLPALEEHPDALFVAGVADPLIENARSFAEKFSARAFASPEAMLDSLAGQLDAVLITSPHFLLFVQARMALERGLCALIETPVACSLAEVRELIELERRPGAFVQAGQMQRFGTTENWIKRWLGGDDFGEPRLFNLDIYQNI